MLQTASGTDSNEVFTPIVILGDENLTKLIHFFVNKVNCLPDLVSKVESIDKNLANVENRRQDLTTIDLKLTTFINQCKSNLNAIRSLKNRVTKLESTPVTPGTNTSNKLNEIKRDIELSITRTYEIVIIGLPIDLLKNVNNSLTSIAIYLDIDFAPWHVAQTREFKVPDKNDVILFVRFNAPHFRTIWLKAKKTKGAVKCSDIFTDQPDNLIYINERQSKRERLDLLEAKKVCKKRNFSNCWMTDGKILFKKTPEGRVLEYKTNISSAGDAATDISTEISHYVTFEPPSTVLNIVNETSTKSPTPPAPIININTF